MSACTIARAKRERTDEEFAETASGRHASAFRIECHGQDRTAAVRSRLLGCFALCRAGAGADPHLGFGGRRRRQPVQPHRAVQDLSRRDLEDRGGRRNHCLDPGGFGGVTITKAMTIACEGVTAGVLVSGTNAIIVSAGPSDQVTLRGLDINGAGTGINGIRFLAGKAPIVDNCQIYEFTTNGIDVALGATGSSLTVKDTRINNLGGVGIRAATTVGGVSASVDHVNISRVTTGVESATGGNTSVSNSIMFAGSNGALASANGAVMTVVNSVMSSNNVGANASVSGATIALICSRTTRRSGLPSARISSAAATTSCPEMSARAQGRAAR